MQFSYRWLCQYLDFDGGPEKLAAALTSVGMSVEQVEEIDESTAGGETDWLLEVEITTNRADAMNHLGLAREAAVKLGAALRSPVMGEAGTEGGRVDTSVEVVEPELCPRFTARVIEGVEIKPSPDWLVRRLQAIGQRPINNIVDITNFVLWELGQPQHAYDLDKLAERRLVVRLPRPGETITTLDGQQRELDEQMLMICDAERPVGVGGVMGGLDTEVGEQTRNVLLESAYFNPRSVRRTSKRLGLHTDASHRFERGADFGISLRANDRASALIAELAGGTVQPGFVDVIAHEHLPECGRIEVAPAAINAFAGADIAADDAHGWLTGLGFGVERDGDDSRAWVVVPPTWRALDVELPADVSEEVMRVFGFDNIPSRLPSIAGADAPESLEQRRRRILRDQVAASGYVETINYAFQDDGADAAFPPLVPCDGGRGSALRLANPLSDRYSVMRRSLLPGLVRSAEFNLNRGAEAVRLFEIGHVFGDRELEALAMIAGGSSQSPWQQQRPFDYFDLKGTIEALAETVGVGIEARAETLQGLVEGTSAALALAQGGARVGVIGQVDIDGAVPLFAAELLTESFGDGVSLGLEGGARPVLSPSRFPGIAMDMTLTHSVEVDWQTLEASIASARQRGLAADLLSFELRDRYQGRGVPAGAVNTTVSFLFGSYDRSVTQDSINEQHERLARALVEQHGFTGGEE